MSGREVGKSDPDVLPEVYYITHTQTPTFFVYTRAGKKEKRNKKKK